MSQFCIPEVTKYFTLYETASHRVNNSKKQQKFRSIYWSICGIAWMSFVGCASAANTGSDPSDCGPLGNNYLGRPVDYRSAPAEQRQLVEGMHFTKEVELLKRGNTSEDPVGDLDYTLRVFPNHPRALRSIMEWEFRKKIDRPRGKGKPFRCYFDLAIRFQPNDAQVRMLFGVYLQRKGKFREAILQLEEANKLVGDNANIHYNIALVYLDLGEFDKSLYHAHRAYALGFPLEGLRNRLKRAGKWREASPVVDRSVIEPQDTTSISNEVPEEK